MKSTHLIYCVLLLVDYGNPKPNIIKFGCTVIQLLELIIYQINNIWITHRFKLLLYNGHMVLFGKYSNS